MACIVDFSLDFLPWGLLEGGLAVAFLAVGLSEGFTVLGVKKSKIGRPKQTRTFFWSPGPSEKRSRAVVVVRVWFGVFGDFASTRWVTTAVSRLRGRTAMAALPWARRSTSPNKMVAALGVLSFRNWGGRGVAIVGILRVAAAVIFALPSISFTFNMPFSWGGFILAAAVVSFRIRGNRAFGIR